MSAINRTRFYFGYALRSLRREGIRTFLAGLSVMFGVLSLVSMQVLSGNLLNAAMFDDRVRYGGDAQIWSAEGGNLTAAELEQIAGWQRDGLIAESATVALSDALYLRTQESGKVTFLNNAFGIDVETYPLVGSWELREPAGLTPEEALRNDYDTLISRDLAESMNLALGDTLLMGGGDSAPAWLTVAGILNSTPNQQGDEVFYTLETARLIEGRDDVMTYVVVNWGDAPNAAQTVIDSPMQVLTAMTPEETVEANQSVSLFDVMLRGAGVLGLLVGGLGVSNTLQVVLARRKLEIAMLKTLGWRRGMLFTLIGLETGILGVISSVIGAGLGVWVGMSLLDMLGETGALLRSATADPAVVVGGVLAGSATAVVFGLQSILASSATRPIQLLRDLPLKTPGRVFAGRGVLFGVLVIIFGALVGIAMGSPLEGIAYVLVGGVLLLVLRGVFWAVLWVVLKLPLPRLQMLRLAKVNLNRRKAQASLIVIALFAGAFSVTLAAVVINNAQTMFGEYRGSDEGYNLRIDTTVEGEAEARRLLAEQGAVEIYTGDVTYNGFEPLPDDPNAPTSERTAVSVLGKIPVERLRVTANAIGAAIPDAFVLSLADVNDMMASMFRTLFSFSVSVAGLAFAAGAVLIANSAGLTVVERCREIGVFKAVGYTSAHVMRLLLGEYGFLGLLSGIFGIIAVVAVIVLINLSQPGAELTISPAILAVMTAFSVGIALVSAAVVVWQAARVRPLDVLRYE